jgi:hypothetical protein
MILMGRVAEVEQHDEVPADVTTRTGRRQGAKWQRHLFSRQESIRTTWKLRLALLMLGILLVAVTRGLWTRWIGHSLVCQEAIGYSDVILVENFTPNYLLFERAAALHTAGLAPRILVPTPAARGSVRPNSVSQGFVEVMARVAQLPEPEVLPIQMIEPISLNAASQIRDFLTTAHHQSVMVVTSGFRSQRASLIYQAVLAPAGIRVYCVPVFGQKTPANWSETWHGMLEVTEQFLKLQYYRFYVLLTRT